MLKISAGVMAFVSAWWRALVGFVVAAPLFFLLGQCDGRKSERADWEAMIARNAAAAERNARAADEERRRRQAADQIRITTNREEVNHATQKMPDAAPSARQRARACLELRRQAAAAGAPAPTC